MYKRRKFTLFNGAIFILYSLVFLVLTHNQCSPDKKQTSEEKRSELIQTAKWWKKLPRPVYANLEKVKTSQ